MKKIITIAYLLISAIAAYSQAWSVSASIGPSYHVADNATRPAATIGIHRDLDMLFSLSLYSSITTSTASDNISRSPILSITPALTTHIYDSRRWSLSADLGIGLGHTFSREATDHNHHTYLIALPLEYYIRPDISLFAYPAVIGRSWQSHIGFNRNYLRIAIYIGYRIAL